MGNLCMLGRMESGFRFPVEVDPEEQPSSGHTLMSRPPGRDRITPLLA